jgi:hypothetical protein
MQDQIFIQSINSLGANAQVPQFLFAQGALEYAQKNITEFMGLKHALENSNQQSLNRHLTRLSDLEQDPKLVEYLKPPSGGDLLNLLLTIISAFLVDNGASGLSFTPTGKASSSGIPIEHQKDPRAPGPQLVGPDLKKILDKLDSDEAREERLEQEKEKFRKAQAPGPINRGPGPKAEEEPPLTDIADFKPEGSIDEGFFTKGSGRGGSTVSQGPGNSFDTLPEAGTIEETHDSTDKAFQGFSPQQITNTIRENTVKDHNTQNEVNQENVTRPNIQHDVEFSRTAPDTEFSVITPSDIKRVVEQLKRHADTLKAKESEAAAQPVEQAPTVAQTAPAPQNIIKINEKITVNEREGEKEGDEAMPEYSPEENKDDSSSTTGTVGTTTTTGTVGTTTTADTQSTTKSKSSQFSQTGGYNGIFKDILDKPYSGQGAFLTSKYVDVKSPGHVTFKTELLKAPEVEETTSFFHVSQAYRFGLLTRLKAHPELNNLDIIFTKTNVAARGQPAPYEKTLQLTIGSGNKKRGRDLGEGADGLPYSALKPSGVVVDPYIDVGVPSIYQGTYVQKITLKRTPLPKFMEDGFEALSNNTWAALKKKHSFDDFFHLALVVNSEILIEKNASGINIVKYVPYPSEERTLSANGFPPPNRRLTVQDMMQATNKAMGDKYTPYDPFENNCQMFVASILSANNLMTSDLRSFVVQSTENLLKDLPSYFVPMAKSAAASYGVVEGLQRMVQPKPQLPQIPEGSNEEL